MKYLTRKEFSEAVFQAIKAELKTRGFSLWEPNFDPNYPISLRSVNYIRRGSFSVNTLNKLPGIKVQEFFVLEEQDQTINSEVSE